MMTKTWDKKVLCVLMQWEYCDRLRGVSGDKLVFLDNISKLVRKPEAFWYDEYIGDLPRLRRLVYEKAEALDPDLIFFATYTGQFDPGTLDKLKERWPTCAWFGDDTWRFDGYSSKLAPHFTHVCTTDVFSVEKYRALGVEPILTQWAGQSRGASEAGPPQGDGPRFDVSFVGGYNHVRGWFVKMLEQQGIKVECFGHGWPRGRVSAGEMDLIFRDSRINLNLSNSVSRDIRFLLGSPGNFVRYLRSQKAMEQIKARNFEIPLAGGFQLTNYVPGLERYLDIGKEVTVYSSPGECAALIRYYLRNEKERLSIAAAGRARAEAEHTYLRRFGEIFEKIWH